MKLFARTALCMLGVAAVFMVARPPASAQTSTAVTYDIEIGQFPEGVEAESMAFYPSSLKVRSGDVLHYTNEFGSIAESGVHGVLALPPGEEPLDWAEQNARNMDGEWSFFHTDEDDDAGDSPSAVKANWKVLIPSDLSCGTAENPCITGTSPASQSPLNSGVSDPLNFHLKVEADPGTRIWLLCPIHPKMKMKVDVVAEGEPTTTPEEIESANEAKLLLETEKAERLDRIFSERRTSVLRKDGTRVWDAWAGVERGTVSLMKMYPEKLSIKEGDSVKWHFEDLKVEIHSVSFPLATALDVHNAPWIALACDVDTDEGTAPDLEPQGGVCPSPPSDVWEADLDSRFYFPAGNGRVEDDEYESSGMRGPVPGMPRRSYTLRFPQSSGVTVWDYACQLHPTMRGAVRVLP